MTGAAARHRHHLIALGALLLMLVGGHAVRAPDIAQGIGVQNIETPWHTLLTIEAMAEAPASEHAFLPIVTLGRPADLGIPWGGGIPDEDGRYYYTSATTLTFLLPYAWFSAFGLEPTIANLAGFNFATQIVALLIMYGFLFVLLQKIGVARTTAALSAAGALSIAVFSREALLAFGIVHWFHAVYAALLATILWLILRAVTAERAPPFWQLALIALACFFGAWNDWSGFVFCVGAAGVLVLFDRSRRSIALAAAVLAGAVGAGLAILAHYAMVVDIVETVAMFKTRLAARSPIGGHGPIYNLFALLQGYVLSFGLFLLVTVAAVVAILRAKLKPDALKLVLLLTLASAAPLGQNVVLLENSAQFSYERLKAFVPAAIVIAVALALAGPRMRAGLVAGLAAASLFGVWSYKEDNTFYSRWRAMDEANLAFRDEVVAQPEHECAVYLTNVASRGYSTLLFRRMQFEAWMFRDADGRYYFWDLPEEDRWPTVARAAMEQTGACTAILLEAKQPNEVPPFTDMPEYVAARIGIETGSPRIIRAREVLGDNPRSPFVRLLSYAGHD